jgi:PAS domain S-box-containing protein
MTGTSDGKLPDKEIGFYLLKAVEQSRDGIIVIDREGSVQFVNRAWTGMFGVEYGDMMGKGLETFHSSQSMTTGVKPFIAKVKAQGHHEADLDLVLGNGERFRGSLAATLLHNDVGEEIGLLAIIRDVTDYEKTKQALAESESQYRQSEEKYSKLFQFSHDAIFLHDLEGRILDANQSALDRMGYGRAELLSRRITDLHHPNALEEHRKAFEAVTRDGFVNFEADFLTKGGKVFPAEVASSLVEISGQHVVQDIVRDISERKRIEEQFRAAQRMESVGRLAGGIAHDFNNLLGAITGYSDLALREVGEDGSLRKDLEEISKAAKRAADLTRQLLAFSRKQVLEPKVLDLNALIRNLEEMLRRLIGEDIELITSLDESLGSIKADPSQIEQVVMNLAVNGRDAMPDGGKLIVETSNTQLDQEYADQHLTAEAGDYVMLAVTDTGMGMDEATRSKIFEPFFTTKPVGKGTGLGLSTVYGIVQQSGGTIWVYSNPAEGTTFKVYFPLASGKPEEAEEPLATDLQGTETILLVEDEKVLRRLIRRMLASNGYSVLEASHGREAIQILEAHEKPVDLLLTDVVMPQMGGKKLAERLAGLRPEMRILYMSGYTDNAIVHQGVLDEGVAYIQKPFSVSMLVSKVRRVLDER